MEFSDERAREFIKEYLPENVSFTSDGELHGRCKIEGTLGDILDFIRTIYWEGYENG